MNLDFLKELFDKRQKLKYFFEIVNKICRVIKFVNLKYY